jgi:hypothetical protein
MALYMVTALDAAVSRRMALANMSLPPVNKIAARYLMVGPIW